MDYIRYDDLNLDYRTYVMARIVREYLRFKTVLIVTDRVDICKLADRVVVMNRGSIEQHGDYQSLADVDGLFNTIMANQADNDDVKEVKADGLILNGSVEYDEKMNTFNYQRSRMQTKVIEIKANKVSKNLYVKVKGQRSWKLIFSIFFFNSGKWMAIAYIILLIITQLLTYTFGWFIAQWKSGSFQIMASEYLKIYGGIVLATFCTLLLTIMVFIRLFRRVSFRFFLKIVRSLLSEIYNGLRKHRHRR